MLDYKKLSKEFTRRLKEFDKEKLESWIDYDNNRDLNKLLKGEKVTLHIAIIKVNNISDPRETILNEKFACSLETAA